MTAARRVRTFSGLWPAASRAIVAAVRRAATTTTSARMMPTAARAGSFTGESPRWVARWGGRSAGAERAGRPGPEDPAGAEAVDQVAADPRARQLRLWLVAAGVPGLAAAPATLVDLQVTQLGPEVHDEAGAVHGQGLVVVGG